MNHEPDVLNRLVGYHDHIVAPFVPLADDLARGRRRVRRNRGLLAGGVALGLASVIAAVSLFTGERAADRPQPVGPPRLSTPLEVPESPLDVRELGFHVEPVPGMTPNQDWTLAPDHQATTLDWAGNPLFVRVYYPAAEPPDWQLNVGDGGVQAVKVHGVAGTYVEQFGKKRGVLLDFSAGTCGTPPRGCDFWQSQLMWEFAPGSWASIFGLTGESPPPQDVIRPAFLKVAEALRSGGGGVTTRVPFRVETDLGPLPPPTESGVGLAAVDHPPGATRWVASFYGEPTTLQFSVDGSSCRPDAREIGTTVQPFTYRGHQGCVLLYEGEASGVALRVDGVDRVMSNPWGRYRTDVLTADHVADLKQWLADLTVAPLDDPSTWFDLNSALGD